ncbi:hypothetical protein BGZ95_004547, partial [Linnemannia exigua]
NGYSDPYVKLTIGGHKFTTNVVRKSLNPVWDACWFPLKSIPQKKFSKITGEVEVKFGFIDIDLAPSRKTAPVGEIERIWAKLASGRNKLGLGQRKVHTPGDTSVNMADIPVAVGDEDPSMGLSALRLDSPSPPPNGALTASSSASSTLSSLSSTNNLRGVVFMEIVSASNLPRTHNVTRTGFDMDPFVVISFGKYIFRTRVIRHNLNPTWRGKLMFRVHHGEDNFKIKYSVHDWDKLSGNDYIGMTTMDIETLISAAQGQEADPLLTPRIGTFDEKEAIDQDMKEYILKVDLASNIKPPAHPTTLKVHAKFVTYTNLRKRFWLGLAKAFDADPKTGLYSKVLIQAMLEGLGSTLSNTTIDNFFTPYSKDPERDELTFDELFEILERQVRLDDSKPNKQRRRRLRKFWSRKASPAIPQSSPIVGTEQPGPERTDILHPEQQSDDKDSTEDSLGDDDEDEDEEDNELFMHLTQNKIPDEGPIPQAVEMVEPTEADFEPLVSEDEYVIRISSCPICRDPSLGSKLETDVITHIAVCSGNDGFNLDKLILGNFVTAANAQRKWITKVVKTLGYGRYMIGKSNANIIVQDRTTGLMLEEKIPTFIRLGIRLLYKGPAQKIRVGKILANMSRKQGLKFDDPRSKRNIEPFIRFHHLEAHMDEVLEPVSNFRSFNEFFYRKLKPDARQLSNPGDDRVAVSVADCRMTCFQTISDAQQFWIKGRQFTVAKLLGGDETLAKKYDGGSLAIFRLAPQDYHRYHIPVKGVLSKPKSIDGEYFTVNPMSIRSHLDVYGENKRVISTIESKEFGTVAYCTIGAMMVGSIVLTTEGGQTVERMEEHGYFAFGGSTIVLLFEPNSIQFDDDLIRSSKEQLEMLVRVGMRVGVSTRTVPSV